MRTAKAVVLGGWLLGAGIPAAARGELSAAWTTCELRYVNRATTHAARCLACHDGTAGPSVGTGHGSHPVDVRYAAVGGFRAPEEIATMNLVLADGQVTCTTCHDWRSGLEARTSTRGLCSGCHEK